MKRKENRLRYLLERRKVVLRTAANLARWSVGEPLRTAAAGGGPTVVFVCQNARARTFNLAYALKHEAGVRTVLFSRVFEYTYMRKAFDEIRFFARYTDLARSLGRLARNNRILAAIGSTEPIAQSMVLLDMQRYWPVLVDQFDSYWASTHFAGMEVETDPRCDGLREEIRLEAHCFTHCDGVVARTGELPLLLDKIGVRHPVLLLEDGCNRMYFQEIHADKYRNRDDWSLVYPGIFYPMHLDPAVFGSAQLLPYARPFALERLHFHLHPSPVHEYAYPEYEAEARKNPYFHLHPAIDFDKVQRKVSTYDFGWYANRYRQYGFTSETYRQFAVATKVCTFLEAGIPVVSNRIHSRIVDIVQRYNCGILVGEDAPQGLRGLIAQADLPLLLKGVASARKALDVNARAGDLLRLIETAGKHYRRKKKHAVQAGAPAE